MQQPFAGAFIAGMISDANAIARGRIVAGR